MEGWEGKKYKERKIEEEEEKMHHELEARKKWTDISATNHD